MGIEGNIKDFPLTEVLNLLIFSNKSGILKIYGVSKGEKFNGEVYIVKGKIMDAKFNSKKGEEALFSILSLEDGNFNFEAKELNIKENIKTPMESLILEAIRRRDETKELYKKIPPTSTLLETNPNPPTKEFKLSSDEWVVLNLFKEKKTISEAIKESPLSEFKTVKAIYALLSLGLLIRSEREEIDISTIIPRRAPQPVRDALSILGFGGGRDRCSRFYAKVDGEKSLKEIKEELGMNDKEVLECFIKLLKETRIISNLSIDKLKFIEKRLKEG